jgi:transcription initiation factor TFIID subunit 13
MEELVIDYIQKLCGDANKLAKYRGHVKTEDFLFVLGKEPKRLARARELLALDKELKRARQAFNVADFTTGGKDYL